MQITLNGLSKEIDGSVTLAVLLADEQLQGRRIAVEINGEIVPRGRHAEQSLRAGDHIEIVQAIGGG